METLYFDSDKASSTAEEFSLETRNLQNTYSMLLQTKGNRFVLKNIKFELKSWKGTFLHTGTQTAVTDFNQAKAY